MPQAKRSATRRTARKKTAKRSTTTARGPRSLGRLEKAVDAAQGHLKDLRKELGRSGRDIVKDLDKALSDSRKNLRSLTQTVAKDVSNLQKAATSGRKTTARKTTTRKRTAAKKSTATRKAAKRSRR
jgi:ribonuclease E